MQSLFLAKLVNFATDFSVSSVLEDFFFWEKWKCHHVLLRMFQVVDKQIIIAKLAYPIDFQPHITQLLYFLYCILVESTRGKISSVRYQVWGLQLLSVLPWLLFFNVLTQKSKLKYKVVIKYKTITRHFFALCLNMHHCKGNYLTWRSVVKQ